MKKFLLYCSSLLILASCNNANPPESANTSAKEIVLKMYDAFNAHDWEKMASYYSDSALFKDPSFANQVVLQTHKDIIEKYSVLGTMFPDVKDSVLNIYTAENNHVVVEFISYGSMGDTGRWELPIATIFKIENNKIVEDFTYYNNAQ